MKISRIYITGFMGSGKSTLGPIVANTIGWNSYDIDSEIEKRTGMKVTEIFKSKGEKFFRELESSILDEHSKEPEVVVSLGGGTIAYNNNYDIIKKTGVLVYLKSSPEKIFLRLKHKTDRPLFQTFDNLILSDEEALQKIKRLLSEREKYYRNADIIIDIDGISVGRTVDRLVRELKKKFQIVN